MTAAAAPRVQCNHNLLRVEGFARFGGRHCETSAVRKVLSHLGAEYTEEFLFGMAGGIGFIFWNQAGAAAPFVGGRNGKFPQYAESLGSALGHKITVRQTGSEKAAYAALVSDLAAGRPVVCYGDIAYLPYFHTDRHFGGHAFVVYAIDESTGEVWISDRGEYPRLITSADLGRARGSGTSVFRPKNAQLRIDVNRNAEIGPGDILATIERSREAMCEPPISNFGLKGIQKFGAWLKHSIEEQPPAELARLLVSAYVNLELAGTGGCAFRRMYRQFLAEAREYLPGSSLDDAIEHFERAIEAWSHLINGLLPAAGAASIELKQQLDAKERSFEKAPTNEVGRGTIHARRVGELVAPAGHEFATRRRELARTTGAIDEIVRWETAAFEALATLPQRYS